MSDRMTDVKDQATPAPRRTRHRCPICGEPAERHWRPFCSKRCADIDLGRWLGEAYRIPAAEAPDATDDETLPPSSSA